MNVEEQEKRLLDYKWHERRYSKDTCYILSTQGTEEPIIIAGNKNSDYVKTFEQIMFSFGDFCEVNCVKWLYSDKGNYNDLKGLKVAIDKYNSEDTRPFGSNCTNYRYYSPNTIGGLMNGRDTCYAIIKSMDYKIYITFWNLFLCSLDDDIYNEQISLVIELAHCFQLDEHIMRDLCRGVEYVLSGKKLSPDCDLQCDTVECARFFLGKEE